MTKYKVGDTVRIIEDVIIEDIDEDSSKPYFMDNCDTYDVFNTKMLQYCGEMATITHVGMVYNINLDNGTWSWTDEMFVEEPTYPVEY